MLDSWRRVQEQEAGELWGRQRLLVAAAHIAATVNNVAVSANNDDAAFVVDGVVDDR